MSRLVPTSQIGEATGQFRQLLAKSSLEDLSVVRKIKSRKIKSTFLAFRRSPDCERCVKKKKAYSSRRVRERRLWYRRVIRSQCET